MQHPQRNGGRNLEAIGMGVGVVMVLGFLMLQQQVGSSMISPGKREGLLARMSQQQHAHGIAATAGAAEVDMRLSHLEEVTSKLRSSSKISSLTAEVGHLQQENSALQREFHTLVDEMEHLKTLMRQHHELKDDIDKTTDKTKAHHDSSSDDSASSDSTDTSNTEDHNKEDSSAEASEASSDEVDIHLLPDERRATGLNAALQNIDCPVPTPMLQMEIPLEHLPRKKRTTVAQKYDRRAGNCNKHGLWSSVSREDHFKIMSKIGDLIRVKQGDLLFDWGCGCGHKLHWFAQKYNTSGLGVDLSYKSLLYAWQNTSKTNKYCHGDGSNLDWIPDNTFDAVFSFGSIFHVYNETLMCRSYTEMVRIAKKGARIFNGWTAEDEWPNSALYHCLRNTKVERVEVLRELDGVFAGIKTFPTKYKGWTKDRYTNPDKPQRSLMRPVSYTHLITK